MSNRKHSVSVIIPAFNAETTIEKCLSAIVSQRYPVSEIIVVDDGSSDRTGSLAAVWAQVIVRPVSQGPGAARNAGARMAQGDILAFIDSDCIPPDYWLEKIVAAFADEKVGAVGGGYLSGIDKKFWQEFCCQELKFRRRHRNGEVVTLVSNNMACRKDVFLETGGFPEEFPVCEDMLLSYRISLQHKVLWLSDNGVVHHFKNSLKEFLAHQYYFGAESIRFFLLNPQVMATGNHQTKSLHLAILLSLMAIVVFFISVVFVIWHQSTWSFLFAMLFLGLLLIHFLLYIPFICFLKGQGFKQRGKAYVVSLLRDLYVSAAIADGFCRVFIKK